jgi:Tfp pilus assembly protein PilO
MTELLYLLTLCLPLATVLLVFGMRYFSAVQQAKARLSQGDAYRQIAERAVTAESQTAAALSSIQAALETVRTRLTAIEQVLKQVE